MENPLGWPAAAAGHVVQRRRMKVHPAGGARRKVWVSHWVVVEFLIVGGFFVLQVFL